MVLFEPAGQGFGQGGMTGLDRAVREVREGFRAAFPGDQGFEHGASGDTEGIGFTTEDVTLREP
ncbi:hypothetical protein [Streptomyces sp. NBC_01264]|uniref:hypothetical protein n=1 Tax=Streptomyces sp. NBC_01264 TaxID=2903804 RepID=UPI002250347E|nr:hypothetical protein [Streptomyces sp. NBC_01264]MCX4783705.1 hypothetical protein [Streptomyces sp. NBC_01264]